MPVPGENTGTSQCVVSADGEVVEESAALCRRPLGIREPLFGVCPGHHPGLIQVLSAEDTSRLEKRP
jgi:hypothetical protein